MPNKPMKKKEECNCQYEEGHSLKCPLYKKSKNPFESSNLKEECKCKKISIENAKIPIFWTKDCILHSSDFTTKKMEEFDKIFVNENLWKSNNEDIAFVGIGNIKSFLSQSLQQARQHERELIKEKLSKMKKKTCDCENDEGLGYHTKECDFTPYGYNQALDDIINNLL